MVDLRLKLKTLFEQLDVRIAEMNRERGENGGPRIPRSEVKILGQMSLLSNEAVSAVLSLAETGDLDALVDAEYAVLRELKTLLRDVGLIYDELSPEIWIPPGASFETLFEFSNIVVKRIDPESALVSKAVKAREKNRLLVQEAVASEKFPNLLARIEKHGGDLAYFLEE